jgi:hypothetical protein
MLQQGMKPVETSPVVPGDSGWLKATKVQGCAESGIADSVTMVGSGQSLHD